MGLPVGVPTKRGPPLPEDFLNNKLLEADSQVVVAKEVDSKAVVTQTDSKLQKSNNSAISGGVLLKVGRDVLFDLSTLS